MSTLVSRPSAKHTAGSMVVDQLLENGSTTKMAGAQHSELESETGFETLEDDNGNGYKASSLTVFSFGHLSTTSSAYLESSHLCALFETMARGGRRRLGTPDDPNGVFAGGETHVLRSRLRVGFKKRIVRKTGYPRANMRFTARGFHDYVFKRWRLVLPGWPRHILFQNLSYLRKAEVLELLELLENGRLRFEEVDEDEYYAHTNDIKGVAPGQFKRIGNAHPGRCDNKKSRFNKETGEPVSCTRKLRLSGAKTPKYCFAFREVWVEGAPSPEALSAAVVVM
ncbi:hypothetical protein GSI_09452 [Ganoderma sinense ZZ0214-1]|uniref:Uncharacterized protein n=1 Tax=Ganoderma sinense ZZ0214-1 TaxID=1077348 RepID=A0A2G8S6J8_9APHY|nr:hypothetical protein GSI_09452 [Ganoderma sinense ZZ0214-1]